ncbi:MAG: redoxin domain-containing protein [Gammaproteobacteria bacterium]|nr:redoxin domain-containing protein [Gammaproteobacteria bacterium]
MTFKQAPELQTTQWLNTGGRVTLEGLRGRVVLIEAFQMLCPGCVSHGLPLAKRAAETFSIDDLVVLGLHTVFEHHAAQGTPEALAAFLHEYRIDFPVGIDVPAEQGGAPMTMRAYNMQGTPTLILVDRQGRLRKQKFGMEQEMSLGAEIMTLIREKHQSSKVIALPSDNCDENGCTIK